jgi:cell wall-associated NlpC family hydrolase
VSTAGVPRRLLSTVVAGTVLALTVLAALLAAGGPAAAAPTASWDQLEKVGEQYKANQAELTKSQAASAALAKQLQPLQAKADAAYQQVAQAAVVAYKGGTASAFNTLLTASSAGSMLDQVSFLNELATTQHRTLTGYQQASKTLATQKAKLDAVVVADTKKAKDLAAQKAKIQAQMDQVAAQNAQNTANNNPTNYVPPTVAGGAGKAVSFAYDQVGKPYVWDAAGPDSYDCSGLTMAAWAQAGVSMAHFTNDQYSAFPKVSRADLQPGDLVFWNDLDHVGIFVGGGKVIHAPQPGESVKVSNVDDPGSYYGAVRP